MDFNAAKWVLGINAVISIVLSYFTLKIFETDMFEIISDIARYNDTSTLTKSAISVSAYMVILTAVVFFVLKKLTGGKGLEKGRKKLATSQFAKLKEFEGVTGDDGLILGKKFRLSMDHSFSHHGLIGVTGSGKSSHYFIPNLVSNPKVSFIVTDPKGELFEKTAKENIKQGKRILVFSPFAEETLKYNPLSLCRSYTEITELAQSLLANGAASVEAVTGQKGGSGSEWVNMATPLLTAFLIFVRELPAPKNTITYALELIIENDMETLEYIIEGSDSVAEKQFNIFKQAAGSEATASSIKTVLSTNLQMFTDPMIKNLTSENEIVPELLREKPTALYVVIPEQKSDFMAPIMATFYRQLIGRLMEIKGAPIFMFLDEFANIGIIGGIDKYLAVVRSRKISISIGLQSLNQLSQKYGQDTSVTILDNLKTKSILPGSSYETANYFSKLIGSEEVESSSVSWDRESSNRNYSENKQTRELISADEVRRLPDGKVLILTDNKNPYIDDQDRYYLNEEYLNKTKSELDINEYVIWYRNQQKKRG